MRILSVTSLAIPDIKVIRFARFADPRGYFAEHYRESDFGGLEFLAGASFRQCNESYSRPGTIRGLHFQWNPYMGKLVRTLRGRMVDLVLDIRKGSPWYGKAIAHDMPNDPEDPHGEWIWVPPGFAHGNFYPAESSIEYFCTGEYSPRCEAGISPVAPDLDWSLADPELHKLFRAACQASPLMSDKDRDGLSLGAWGRDERSENFVHGSC